MLEGSAAPVRLVQLLTDMHAEFAAATRGDEPDMAAQHAALLAQLRTLAEFIDLARQEIAAVGASDIVGRDVTIATDELDAVVLHTAEATGLILDECEKLEAAVQPGPLRGTVTDAAARIYEACSFQDITGQRVAKVVQTLKTIEEKVGDMLRVFGCGPAAAVPRGAHALLNGPQRSGDAMEQSDVDALLASFE